MFLYIYYSTGTWTLWRLSFSVCCLLLAECGLSNEFCIYFVGFDV